MLKCDNSFKTDKKIQFAQDLYRYSSEQKYGTKYEYINTKHHRTRPLKLLISSTSSCIWHRFQIHLKLWTQILTQIVSQQYMSAVLFNALYIYRTSLQILLSFIKHKGSASWVKVRNKLILICLSNRATNE